MISQNFVFIFALILTCVSATCWFYRYLISFALSVQYRVPTPTTVVWDGGPLFSILGLILSGLLLAMWLFHVIQMFHFIPWFLVVSTDIFFLHTFCDQVRNLFTWGVKRRKLGRSSPLKLAIYTFPCDQYAPPRRDGHTFLNANNFRKNDLKESNPRRNR